MKKRSNNQFGKFIKRLREDKKMTLRDVEAKSGISTTYLNQQENHMGATLSDDKVRVLAKVYDAPVEKFYLLSGRMPPDELAACIAAREHLEKFEFINLLEDAVNEKRGLPRRESSEQSQATTGVAEDSGITEESQEWQENNGDGIRVVGGDRENSAGGEAEVSEPARTAVENQ